MLKKIKFKKPFLIAEIGINHNGSIDLAKKLIDLAKFYKFDAVKFQKRQPEISTPEDQKNVIRSTPWGDITYLEYKKKIEFSYREYKIIDKYCKKKNINWFCSAWDLESQGFLKKFSLKYNKIASAIFLGNNLSVIVLINRSIPSSLYNRSKPMVLASTCAEPLSPSRILLVASFLLSGLVPF